MQTFIREKEPVKLKKPILIEGFPGLGYIGKIVVTYLVRQLKAQSFADLYSPYFPYHVIVSSSSRVRLPQAHFYYWKNPDSKNSDIVLLTGDSQAQALEGQYELTSKILEYAETLGVKKGITIGGCISKSEGIIPKVVCVSTNRQLLNRLLKSGAELSPAGNPIVGIAGLTLGLAKFRKINVACLLGETMGHTPDPKVSKEVLRILQQFLELNIDLTLLDKEIEKSKEIYKKMGDIQKKMEDAVKERMESDEKKITYIS